MACRHSPLWDVCLTLPWLEMLSVPHRRNSEGKGSFIFTSWPKLKQNSVDEASKWFSLSRGNKGFKSDTLCPIIILVNVEKPSLGMWQHWVPLVCDMVIGAMADQPVPCIPSLPISPKYSPNPRDFNLPCIDTFLSHLSLFAPVWAPQPASISVMHCSQGLLSNFDVEDLFLLMCNISSRYN